MVGNFLYVAPMVVGFVAMAGGALLGLSTTLQLVSKTEMLAKTEEDVLGDQSSGNVTETRQTYELHAAKVDLFAQQLGTAVCAIAALVYLMMVRYRMRSMQNGGAAGKEYAPLTIESERSFIRGLRFCDWALTMPLLAVELRQYVTYPLYENAYGEADRLRTYGSAGVALLMILVGYLSHGLRRNVLAFLASSGLFAALLAVIFSDVEFVSGRHGSTEKRDAAIVFASVWVLYPVAEIISFECSERRNWDDIMFAVLDICSKPGLVLYGALSLHGMA